MSEPKLISPMLDDFLMGDPISNHNGIRCCPAMKKESDEKYIVKIISNPSSRTKLDALLLTGAYADEAAALEYFKELTDGVVEEISVLDRLSQLEGFLPYESSQVVQMEDDTGYDVYLLSIYKRSLDKHYARVPVTHLSALNLGIDLCSALAACRRAGYLYVDLKPSNIFVCGDNEFRIGDLGFLKLDSLKYASLPDKYHSEYTAPEIQDAFSSLNTTIDLYAVGLILYQAYNDGKLPVRDSQNPSAAFPPPAYADYEMSEIILKACAADPADRWEDPMQMGQALVSYMQRNGVSDSPIVPLPVPETAENDVEETITEDAEQCEETRGLFEQTDASETEPAEIIDPLADIPAPEEIAEEDIYYEDESGNLTFLEDSAQDETAPGSDSAEVAYEEVTEEVSEFMQYADELISHPTPDPVVQPEMIDVPIPDPIVIGENGNNMDAIAEEADEGDSEEQTTLLSVNESATPDAAPEDSDEEASDDDEEDDEIPVKVNHLIRNVCIAIIALAIILAGIYYYTNIYSRDVSIQLSGDEGVLTVFVDSNLDDDQLTVICTDTYGNQITASVKNGKAVFEDLKANTAYTVEVQSSGFHRLNGKITSQYSTPAQTSVAQFSAVCGAEDGSAILNFLIDGKDSSQWKVVYYADGEAENEIIFTGHVATVTNLTVGKDYVFTLSPIDDIYFVGENQLTFTASKSILAQNLQVSEFRDRSLTVKWELPIDAQVDSWVVRCYNDSGYNVSTTVNDTSATFTDIDITQSYTVEVTASGMHFGEVLKITKYPINISNFAASVLSPEIVTLTWDSDNMISDSGWILRYTVNDQPAKEISGFTENTCSVPSIPAGTPCTFTLLAVDGSPVIDGEFTYTMPKSENFAQYGITEGGLLFRMCLTPDVPNWNRYHITSYKTSFAQGEKASFLIALMMLKESSADNVDITFIIRNNEGIEVIRETTQRIWNDMWNSGYCSLDIPSIPELSGDYEITVYFNNQIAHSEDFTIE